MVAAIGMATAFVDATLAQLLKVPSRMGPPGRGPAFSIERGLHSRSGGVVFAVLLIFTVGVAFNMVQANVISDVMSGFERISPTWIAMLLMVLVAPILFGGVRRVAKVTEVVLPLMELVYVLLALVFFLMNIAAIPEVFGQIVGGAFGIEEIAGGFAGASPPMLSWVKRGDADFSRMRRAWAAPRTRRPPPLFPTWSSRASCNRSGLRGHHSGVFGDGIHHPGVARLRSGQSGGIGGASPTP